MGRDDSWAEIVFAKYPEKLRDGESLRSGWGRVFEEVIAASGYARHYILDRKSPERLCFFCFLVKDGKEFANRTPYKCSECCVWVRRFRYYKNHDALKIAMRTRLYNITPADLENMMRAQGGRCAICNRTAEESKGKGSLRPLCIDHDHKTGRVRGLLCTRCNQSIGRFGDDIELLTKAAAYLSI